MYNPPPPARAFLRPMSSVYLPALGAACVWRRVSPKKQSCRYACAGAAFIPDDPPPPLPALYVRACYQERPPPPSERCLGRFVFWTVVLVCTGAGITPAVSIIERWA